MTEANDGKTPVTDALSLAGQYVEDTSLDGSWFELGGSSIDAARLVSSLERDYGIVISLKELLCADSVRECLATAGAGSPHSPPSPLAAGPASIGTDPVELLWPALQQMSAKDQLSMAQLILEDLQRRSDLPG